MALLSIYRGTQAEVSERPVSDGALLFATDTKKIYLDKGSSRVEMSSLQDLSDYITSTQLSSAIGAEASARQKQDQLLEQAIDDKLGADDIIAGSNVQVSHNDESGHITISATDTKYTAGTGLGMISNGFYILNGGVGLNQLADDSVSESKLADGAVDTVKIADGAVTADKLAAGVIPKDTNTTYTLTKSGSTITLNGSDGSETSVTDSNTTYTLSSFGITATAAELNKLDGVTATATEINYLDGVTSAIQTQLNGKAASSHSHPVSQVTGLTVSRALISDGDGHPAVSAVTSTELGYLDGVTSAIQTQLNGKAASSHTHSTASTTAAGFLRQLNGSTSNFLRGDGTWATPPNTTYSTMTGATSSAAGSTGLVPAPAAGKQTSFLRGDGTWVVPTNTTYGLATTSANGLLRQLSGSTSQYLRGDGTWATPTATIADGSITSAKLATDAVTSAKIATNAVTSDGIAAGAVGSSELASNAVTLAKLGSDVGTVAVQSSTPSDTNVKLWIQI